MKDVTSDNMTTMETWNDCPKCQKAWKDEVATPGIIHRTRYCTTCKELMRDEVFGHMYERKPTMIIKSPSTQEECALCNRMVPKDALVLRKIETKKVICIPCLVEIAELTIQTPVSIVDKKDIKDGQ